MAAASGRLTIQAQEGDEVKIGQTVALIEEGAAAAVTAPATAPTEPAPDKRSPARARACPPDHRRSQGAKPRRCNVAPEGPPRPRNAADLPLSPSVRRLMEEEHVSPAEITGTGKGGRATKGDVLGFVENRPATPAAPAMKPA